MPGAQLYLDQIEKDLALERTIVSICPMFLW